MTSGRDLHADQPCVGQKFLQRLPVRGVQALDRLARRSHRVARRDEIVREFETYTTEAQGRGVFGSSFYIYDDELFWGQDRLEFLEAKLGRTADATLVGHLIVPMQGAA